ncbi:hypothetical protein GCM10010488_30200 [Oerskovia jenensis]
MQRTDARREPPLRTVPTKGSAVDIKPWQVVNLVVVVAIVVFVVIVVRAFLGGLRGDERRRHRRAPRR